jgi:hypothetical protein
LSDCINAWTKRQKHEEPKKAGILSLSNAFAVGRVIGDLDRERRSAPSDRLFDFGPPRCRPHKAVRRLPPRDFLFRPKNNQLYPTTAIAGLAG